MNTSLSWIKAYVPDLETTPQEYTDAMTLSGSKVEGYQRLDEDLSQIIVGQIQKIEKHPDADKLVVCRVNIGKDAPIQIVTGASNIKEGDKVPVVLDGGRVAGSHDGKMTQGGIKIKKGKTTANSFPRASIICYDVLHTGQKSSEFGLFKTPLPQLQCRLRPYICATYADIEQPAGFLFCLCPFRQYHTAVQIRI